jgi:hypothetical protein
MKMKLSIVKCTPDLFSRLYCPRKHQVNIFRFMFLWTNKPTNTVQCYDVEVQLFELKVSERRNAECQIVEV